MKISAAVLAGLLTGVSLASYAGPVSSLAVPIKIGETLPSARAKLLKIGWKPVRTWSKPADNLGWALVKDFFDAGFTEIQSCAGTGSNPCIFNYQSGRRACLKLFTEGEIPKAATVTGWNSSCPDKPDE